MDKFFDVVVIGAGAAGMMCAAVAGRRGKRVLVLDHSHKVGEKIRISGGGRCNFTNLGTTSKNFISQNPHFAKSALSRYTPQDFIELVEKYSISWHEKTKGQLFCDGSAQQIVKMLLREMELAKVVLWQGALVTDIAHRQDGFLIQTSKGKICATSLVIASGGKSIPKIGASGFGFDVARQFGLGIVEISPALVPLTFANNDLSRFAALAGVSVSVQVSCNGSSFFEDMLFTHRGLSGPAILQISSYWQPGDQLKIRLVPDVDFNTVFRVEKQNSGKQAVQTVLAGFIAKRLAQDMAMQFAHKGNIADLSGKDISRLVDMLENWQVTPTGSEGYRTAEVTRGGVDTNGLNAKTMAAKSLPGLYFIGEVVDVTGWLGGYNFQWAWASGQAAGKAV